MCNNIKHFQLSTPHWHKQNIFVHKNKTKYKFYSSQLDCVYTIWHNQQMLWSQQWSQQGNMSSSKAKYLRIIAKLEKNKTSNVMEEVQHSEVHYSEDNCQ